MMTSTPVREVALRIAAILQDAVNDGTWIAMHGDIWFEDEEGPHSIEPFWTDEHPYIDGVTLTRIERGRVVTVDIPTTLQLMLMAD